MPKPRPKKYSKKYSKQQRTTKKRGGAAGRFSRVSRVAGKLFNEVFGKTGLERIDKAKDVGEAILKEMKKAKVHEHQSDDDNQNNPRMYKILSNSNTNTNSSPLHAKVINHHGTFTVKTPTNRGSRSEPKLPKKLRHMTRSTRVPTEYAPTLGNIGSNPIKNLKSEFDLNT